MIRSRKKSYKKKVKSFDNLIGWLFCSPLLIGLTVFFFIPLGYAVYLSFTNYSFSNIDSYVFVGFDNYVHAFQDRWFTRSLLNALINCIGVPIGMTISLVLSNFLINNKKFSTLFRVIYYIPTICGAVAITFIWQWMYQPMYGLLNTWLGALGFKTINFLGDDLFLGSMIAMGIWNGFGTSVLLLFASLKNISKSLYEAASIDGAGGLRKLWHITVPGVSPTLFFILVTGISGSFQDFARFQVMRGDQITEWSIMPVWYIYKYTSVQFNYQLGYASAMGIILGLIIIVISALQQIISRKWVNYA